MPRQIWSEQTTRGRRILKHNSGKQNTDPEISIHVVDAANDGIRFSLTAPTLL